MQACDRQVEALQPLMLEPIPHCNTQSFILAPQVACTELQGELKVGNAPGPHQCSMLTPVLAPQLFLFVSITPEAGQIRRSNYRDFAQKQTDQSEEGGVYPPLEIKTKQSEDPTARDTLIPAQANPNALPSREEGKAACEK